jgi:ParG
MKETVTCWIQRETHNRLKVFCALHQLSMTQVITESVEDWIKQHSYLSDATLELLRSPWTPGKEEQ